MVKKEKILTKLHQVEQMEEDQNWTFLPQSDDWRYFCQAAKDCDQMERREGGIFIVLQV